MYESETEMKDAATFVKYEWCMFSWAASVIDHTFPPEAAPEEWRMGTGDSSEPEDALVEVLLLHARALRDFFNRGRKDSGVHATDILAEDFFDTPDQWNKPVFIYLSQNKNRLNRALAHLSYDRIGYEVTGKDWNPRAITAELNEAWRTFLAELPEEREAWFR